MADIHRKQRLASRLQQLMKIAIEERQVREGISLSRQIMFLNGWTPKADDPQPPEEPPRQVDMTPLLDSLKSNTQGD